MKTLAVSALCVMAASALFAHFLHLPGLWLAFAICFVYLLVREATAE